MAAYQDAVIASAPTNYYFKALASSFYQVVG